MKAVVVVVLAAVALIGLGYYFANTQFHQASGATAQKTADERSGQERADLHPEKDVGFRDGQQKSSSKDGYQAKDHSSAISFEGAELPGSSKLGVNHHRGDSMKNADEWQDPTFANMNADDEIAGHYVHRKMVYPHKSIAGRAGGINDELLIMEAHSEDRLAAAAAESSSAQR